VRPSFRPGRRRTGVINPADPALASYGQRDTFAARMGQIGPLLGARLHGRRLAWPYRCHHANEETLVTGGGDLRYLAIGTMIEPEGRSTRTAASSQSRPGRRRAGTERRGGCRTRGGTPPCSAGTYAGRGRSDMALWVRPPRM
jgi:hypothetical protein